MIRFRNQGFYECRYIKYICSILICCALGLGILHSQSTTTPFQIINGLIVLNAEIDGRQGDYILDTGSPYLILNRHLGNADDMTMSTLYSMNQSYHSYVGEQKEIKIGEYSLQSLNGVHYIDFEKLERLVDRPLDGLIGIEVFNQSRLTIDFDEQNITIDLGKWDMDILGAKLKCYTFPLHFDEWDIPVIRTNFGSCSAMMVLDSGANITVIGNQSSTNESIDNLNSHDLRIGTCRIKGIEYISGDLSGYNEGKSVKISGILSLYQLNISKVVFDFGNEDVTLMWRKPDIVYSKSITSD